MSIPGRVLRFRGAIPVPPIKLKRSMELYMDRDRDLPPVRRTDHGYQIRCRQPLPSIRHGEFVRNCGHRVCRRPSQSR